MTGIIRTPKQKIIVGKILRLAGEGTFMTQVELHKLMPYTCKYGSFRRSIDFLIGHEVLAKERAGSSVLIKPTTKAYALFSAGE